MKIKLSKPLSVSPSNKYFDKSEYSEGDELDVPDNVAYSLANDGYCVIEKKPKIETKVIGNDGKSEQEPEPKKPRKPRKPRKTKAPE